MSSDKQIQRVLLIDLDNVPGELSYLAGDLSKFDKVIACHGVAEPKIPLGAATQLAAAILDLRLEFVGMARGGKNAADFGIAFLAGKLMTEMPSDTEFEILSKDTGLDHVADMLMRFDRKAKRVTGHDPPSPKKTAVKKTVAKKTAVKKTAVKKTAVKKTANPKTAQATEFCESYLRLQKAGPKNRAALQNAIKSFFRKQPSLDVDNVIKQLIKAGIVKFDGSDRATYSLPPSKSEN